MSSIFTKPEEVQQESKYGVTVLFLHGLEGSSRGSKAMSLSAEWNALCPSLRTHDLLDLRSKCGGVWSLREQEEINEAFETPYSDALDALRYVKPDVIVASSMSGAILFKLISEGLYEGASVFCAPAIGSLLPADYVEEAADKKSKVFQKSVWLLGEVDTVVSNSHNISLAKALGGSVIVSPNDGHRLNKAVESNILNASVLTSIELMEK